MSSSFLNKVGFGYMSRTLSFSFLVLGYYFKETIYSVISLSAEQCNCYVVVLQEELSLILIWTRLCRLFSKDSEYEGYKKNKSYELGNGNWQFY